MSDISADLRSSQPGGSRRPVAITLPDGRRREFPGPVTGAEIAAAIGPGLAKAAIAVKIDGSARDLATVIDHDAAVAIITRDTPEGVEILRHDAAHVMAEAVKELYPETQVTFGPATETGFYYDFARATPFTPEDLGPDRGADARDRAPRRADHARGLGPRRAPSRSSPASASATRPNISARSRPSEEISLYRQGDFVDLCVGPHLPSTGRLGQAFKLMNVAGAYWRGDPKNAQLQRVYGTAWPSQKELDQYLFRLEEAERRDHRKLGRELDLFHLQEEAVGSVFWHPKGWTLYRTIEDYMRRRLDAAGYQEVRAPQLLDRSLWEASGHWENFRENMFIAESRDERVLAVKPMNCPGPCADLPQPAAQLSRIAAASRRIRQLPPQRAVGRLARHHAGARLHPGRRAYLLHRGPGHAGSDRVLRIAAVGLPRFRLRRCGGQVRRPAADARRQRRRLGSSPSATWKRRSRRPVSPTRSTPARAPFTGRSSNSCCATRSAATGNAAPCSSISSCRSGSARPMSARTARRHRAGHAAPRDPRLVRALYRHPDRALRRQFPALAGAGAGRRRLDHRRGGALTPRRWRRELRAAGLRVVDRHRQREDRLQGARAQPRENPGHPGGRPARGANSAAFRCAGSAARRRKPLRLAKPLLD